MSDWMDVMADDADFTVRASEPVGRSGGIRQWALVCRQCEPEQQLFTVGEMEVWEILCDAQDHYMKVHGTAP